MKQRFVNQKLGKRASFQAGLRKAARAADSLRREGERGPAGRGGKPRDGR